MAASTSGLIRRYCVTTSTICMFMSFPSQLILFQLLHYSTIPLFHHPITPLLHHSITPLLHHSITTPLPVLRLPPVRQVCLPVRQA
jgi:hypothetical protein